MDIWRFRYLLNRHFSKNISVAEQQELAQLLANHENEAEVKALVNEIWIQSAEKEAPVFTEETSGQMLGRLMQNINKGVLPAKTNQPIPQIKKNSYSGKWAWAAAILLIATISALFYQSATKPGVESKIVKITPKPVVPGSDGAILTLADGSQVVLDSMQDGKIASQKGGAIVLNKGTLLYEAGATTQEPVFNTVTTPRGRQFKLRLPDGTMVWLNAASSIKYPVAFTGNNRSVEITGEVFFEVQSDKEHPFVVSKDGLSVLVTGTQFNMNTYDDENNMRITLVEGKVEVNKGAAQQLLKPGEQAITTADGKLALNKEVNVDMVLAWKNGYFSFNNTYLQSLMRMLSRWYDVEVEYEGEVPNMKFGGEISRNTPLEDVLNILRESKVQFRIENSSADNTAKIIVSP